MNWGESAQRYTNTTARPENGGERTRQSRGQEENGFGTIPFMSQRLLATMITTTSYGVWPPGDLRGYVDEGVILPGNPKLLDHAKALMTSDPVYFTTAQQTILFNALVSASTRYGYQLFCASVESWHLHWLIDHGFDSAATMVGRLKTAMRKALNCGRIWTEGYDSRYCFTDRDVDTRRGYIMRHAGYRPIPEAIRH
jgi:hypothetical protein